MGDECLLEDTDDTLLLRPTVDECLRLKKAKAIEELRSRLLPPGARTPRLLEDIFSMPTLLFLSTISIYNNNNNMEMQAAASTLSHCTRSRCERAISLVSWS